MKRTSLELCTAAALSVLLSSCLRAAESRARQDETVGQRTIEEASVNVGSGRAVVRGLEPGGLRLWASAPAFDFTIDSLEPVRRTWQIRIDNAMPDSTLTLPGGGTLDGVWTLPTRVEFSVEIEANENIQLQLGPAGWERSEPFRFGLLSDVQTAIDGIGDIIERINDEEDLSFVLGAGDLTERGTERELRRFQHELEAMNVPYYTTLGNHELGAGPPPYHDYFGRGNQSFWFRKTKFTLLDSASATLDPRVYDWLDGWLEEARDDVHIVAMHIPPMDPTGTRHGGFASKNEAAKLLNQLKRFGVDLTLYGHIHTYVRFENAGIPAHIAGGGGAIPNRGDGIGRHYMVIDVDPSKGVTSARVVEVDGDWDYW